MNFRTLYNIDASILRELCFVIFFISGYWGFSQTPEQEGAPMGFLQKNIVIPPSPQAASLGQFGNTPVNLYTGKTSLNIPLYELKGKEISLPISLSYSSGGFKVGEVPGWTGLGWTLNAGGVITRSALGRPDGCSNYYNKAEDVSRNIADLNDIERQDYYKEIADGDIETQPDVYFFNFSNNSGKFYIDAYGNEILTDYQPLSISLSSKCVNESIFTIKGPDGTTYIFEDIETTLLLYDDEGSSSNNFYDYTSSWYLTRIISPNELDVIYFDYEPGGAAPVISNDINSESMSYTGVSASNPCGTPSGSQYAAPSSISINTIYLTGIRLGEVEIGLSSIISGSYFGNRQLNTITVMDKGSQVKKIEFAYSFFDSPSVNYDDRLRLDKIYEYGPVGQLSPPYQFEYSTTLLPEFNSKAIDHWGYYNGGGGGSLIPNVTDGGCTRGGGADREPNIDYADACILKKITYPTGGSTQFEYGINRSGKIPTVQTVNVPYSNPIENTIVGGLYVTGACANFPKFQIVDFTIPGGADEIELSPPGLTWDEQTHGEGPAVFAGLIKASNYTNASACDIYTWASDNYTAFEYYWFLDHQALPSVVPTALDPGNYKLIVVNKLASAEIVSIHLIYTTYQMEERVVTTPDKLIGGLRIERITDYSEAGTTASIKEYDYHGTPTYFNGSYYPYESGLSFGDPKYSFVTKYSFEAPKYYDETPNPIQDYFTQTTHLVASSRTSLGTVLGSHVGYSMVTEKQIGQDGSSNGSKVYHYRNQEKPEIGYPFSHENDTYGQGDLLREEVRDKNGTLLVETINEYAFDINETRQNKTIHGKIVYPDEWQGNSTRLAKFITNNYEWFAPYNQSYYTYFGLFSTPYYAKDYSVRNKVTSYRSYARWQYLSKTTKNEYRGGQIFKTETINLFGNPIHAQVTIQETTNSRGNALITKLKYPGDLIGGLSTEASYAVDQLIFKHVYNKAIEKIVIKDDVGVVSAQKAHYQIIGDKVFPKEVYFISNPVPIAEESMQPFYEKRATYTYNTFGDVTDYRKEADVNQSFVWSSDHLNAITEVNGAASSNVAYTSFEGGANEGNFTFAANSSLEGKTGKRSHSLNGSNIVKSGLQPTIKYELSFWAKNGSPSVTNVIFSHDDATVGSDGWRFFKKIVSGTGQVTISSSGSELIDEIRIHPVGAQMSTYVYEPGLGLTFSSDPNGRITRFEYYNTGKLKQVKDADGNILKGYKYHYKTTEP